MCQYIQYIHYIYIYTVCVCVCVCVYTYVVMCEILVIFSLLLCNASSACLMSITCTLRNDSVSLSSLCWWFCHVSYQPHDLACWGPQQQASPLIWFIQTRSQTRGTVSSCSPYGTCICHPPRTAAGDMKTCPSLASVASLTAECCTKLTVHAGSLPLNPPEVKMKSKWTLFTCLIQGPAFLHIIYKYSMKSEVWKKSQTIDSSFWLSALLEIILPLGQIAKNIATITDSVAFLKSFIVKN